MGLKMTLTKENNRFYHDFIDAYWAINGVNYTTETAEFQLCAYPSREAKLMDTEQTPSSTLPIGGNYQTYDTGMYIWSAVFPTSMIFENGVIPAGKDAQYTAIYNFIKEYTGLPFEDVLED